MIRHRLLSAVLIGSTVLALTAAGAGALWTQAGSGSGTARTGTLAAPTLATPVISGTSVGLSWSPVSAGATGTARYYVTRTPGPSAAACGTVAEPKSITSCSDSAGPGSYSYTVTAVFGSWSATSNSQPAAVVGATKLGFTSHPNSVTAGTAFGTIAVAVQNSAGATVTDSTAPVTLAVTGGTATVTGCTNPVAAVNGVATFTGCRVTTAGSHTLTATSGSLTPATSNSFTVSAGAVAGMALVPTTNVTFTCNAVGASRTCSGSVTNNTGVTARIRFVDSFGNPAVRSAVSATSITVNLTSARGSLTGGPLTVPANSTTSTNTFTLTTNGSHQASMTATSAGTPQYGLTLTLN